MKYAIHNCSTDLTLHIIDIIEHSEFQKQLEAHKAANPRWLVLIGTDSARREYRLLELHERAERTLRKIKEAYDMMHSRIRSIDVFLDKLAELIYNNPRESKIETAWDLETLLTNHNINDNITPAEWITALVQEPEDLIKFRKIAAELEKLGFNGSIDPTEFQDITRNSYLLRYSKDGDDSECGRHLVVMGDHGVTWEPTRTYPTEELGRITGDDPASDAQGLVDIYEGYFKPEEETND